MTIDTLRNWKRVEFQARVLFPTNNIVRYRAMKGWLVPFSHIPHFLCTGAFEFVLHRALSVKLKGDRFVYTVRRNKWSVSERSCGAFVVCEADTPEEAIKQYLARLAGRSREQVAEAIEKIKQRDLQSALDC